MRIKFSVVFALAVGFLSHAAFADGLEKCAVWFKYGPNAFGTDRSWQLVDYYGYTLMNLPETADSVSYKVSFLPRDDFRFRYQLNMRILKKNADGTVNPRFNQLYSTIRNMPPKSAVKMCFKFVPNVYSTGDVISAEPISAAEVASHAKYYDPFDYHGTNPRDP